MTDGGGKGSLRSRLQFTPTHSRGSPGRSSLSRAEIDDILDSPIETDYTYSHSVAYRRSGSSDYTYPRLSRPLLNASGWGRFESKYQYTDADNDWDRTYPYPTDQYYYTPKYQLQPNYFVRTVNWVTWLLRTILVFIITTVAYAALKVTSFVKYLFGYLIWTLLSPILAPVYAVKATILNARYLTSLVKDAVLIVWKFITSFVWQTEYVSLSLWSDLKSFFWRILGYKVPIGRAYTEKLAAKSKRGTRYSMRSEETEYVMQPDEVEIVEKLGFFSRLWYYVQWTFYTILWLLTLGYVNVAPSYASPSPTLHRRYSKKSVDNRSTYMKLWSFFDTLFVWLIWIVTGGPIAKIYRYFYPEMQQSVAHRGPGRPRTRMAPGPAEVPVPRYTTARNKTEQILVNTWNFITENTNKAYTSLLGDTPEKRRKNAAWLWWLPILLLLLLSTYYVGRNTYADYKNETANGVVHNPAEYIASKLPSDVHLIPEGVKNTFSGMEHRLEDIKTGTTNAITGTKDWIAEKSSIVYYSAVQHFYNTLAKFFGGLEYIWNGASYVFYSAVEGVLWLAEKVVRGIYFVTESLFEGSSKFLDKIGYGIKQTASFLVQLPIRLFSAIGQFLRATGNYLYEFIFAIGRFFGVAASEARNFLQNIGNKVYEAFSNIGNNAWRFIRNIGLTIWNFFGTIGNSIYNGLHYVGLKLWQSINYIFANFWNGLRYAGNAIANAHYYLWQALKKAGVAVFEGLKNIVLYVYDCIRSIFSIIWMTIEYLGLMIFNFLSSIYNGLHHIGSKLWQGSIGSINYIFANFWNGLKYAGNAIANAHYYLWQALKNAGVAVFEGLKNIVLYFYDCIVSIFSITWMTIRYLGLMISNFLRTFTFGAWDFIESAGSKTYNFFKNSTWKIYEYLQYFGSTVSNLLAQIWRKFIAIFSLDWLETPVDYIIGKGRSFFSWLISLPRVALNFVYEYILGPVSGWFAYVYRGISTNRTVVPPVTEKPDIQREPVDLKYHETETFSDGHPLMIKLRQIVDEALQREKVELEDRIQSAISEHVGTVKHDVDSKADKLRESYHEQLDHLKREMSTRYNDLIEQQISKFTNVLRAEITAKLPKEEDIEKDMEIRALHAQIDALKDELASQAKGMELELETRVQNIIKRLENMQDTRWKTYTEQLETKFKPKVAPEAELWALQTDIENLKKELKAAHLQKAAVSDGDQLNIDAKITAILDKLMVTEKKAIKTELESIEKRLTEKTQETKITDPNLINLEEELEKKMEGIVSSITRQMNEQNSKFLSELQELRRIYQETLTSRTEATKSTHEIHTLKRELELNEAKYLEDVRRLIREYIQKYDADKTGLPDYALESSGGSVVSTRCTVPYKETSRRESIWGIPLWYSSYGPRSVIQRKSQGVNAGECWAFVGEQGFLTIQLSHRINVTAISYEHLPKELAPQGQLRSAPKEFIIWSYQNADDLSSKVQLGRFVYDIHGESLQMFTVNKHDPKGTPVIELETVSNYGAPLTCLYRFRVHGTPIEDKESEI